MFAVVSAVQCGSNSKFRAFCTKSMFAGMSSVPTPGVVKLTQCRNLEFGAPGFAQAAVYLFNVHIFNSLQRT